MEPKDPNEQMDLPQMPEEVEREETEIDSLVRKTTASALEKLPDLKAEDVERILEARAKLIETIRKVAIRMTQPRHWTLYKGRDGSITAVPSSPATLVMRRWAGISIFNHRGMNGELGVPTRTETRNSKNEPIFVLEMQADVRCGREQITVYANVRSDDQFTGRTLRKEEHGGPRPEDLALSLRTMLDTKAIRVMLAVTKITPEELEKAGVAIEKCTRGAGYGSAAERTAGDVAEVDVRKAAEELWKEILRRCHGEEQAAAVVLKDITAYPAKMKDGKQVYAASPGIDSWERFTKMDKVRIAADKLKKHPMAGDREEPGSEG